MSPHFQIGVNFSMIKHQQNNRRVLIFEMGIVFKSCVFVVITYMMMHGLGATTYGEEVFLGLAEFKEKVKGPLISTEPPHGKTNNLHRRKQRRRLASR